MLAGARYRGIQGCGQRCRQAHRRGCAGNLGRGVDAGARQHAAIDNSVADDCACYDCILERAGQVQDGLQNTPYNSQLSQ
jgi:hypothetical protein